MLTGMTLFSDIHLVLDIDLLRSEPLRRLFSSEMTVSWMHYELYIDIFAANPCAMVRHHEQKCTKFMYDCHFEGQRHSEGANLEILLLRLMLGTA